MYAYSTCMQRGSLHRHIVDVVICLRLIFGTIVTFLLCKVRLLIVTNLLCKVRIHIVPVPIEQLVVFGFIVLGFDNALDFGAAPSANALSVPPPEKALVVLLIRDRGENIYAGAPARTRINRLCSDAPVVLWKQRQR